MNIGIDIVECERCANLVSDKIFAPEELAYLATKRQALPTIAGLYAAKEAYFKAVGTGIIKSQLPKVVVVHDVNGRPYYLDHPEASLSISHTQTTAVAVCVIF